MASPRRIHITSQCLVRNFARNDRVSVTDIRTGQSRERPVRQAAMRLRWWGPDSDLSTAAERALGECENAAAPILRTVPLRWPFDRAERATLAQFFAIHVVRGPSWRNFFAEVTLAALDDVLRQERFDLDVQREALARAMTDRLRIETLMKQIPRVASIFASMHWSLVSFDEAIVAGCDQPVVAVPLLRPGQIAPIETLPRVGYLETSEVRLPVDPYNVLLLTWLDQPDAAASVKGQFRHAADINRSTYAQADRQWFYRPDTHPPRLAPPILAPGCQPCSYNLVPGYSYREARQSRRRAEADRIMRELIKRGTTDVMRWVAVTRNDDHASAA